MNTFAFVDDGIVRDILSPSEGVALEDCLHRDLVASYVACPPEVLPGWMYADGLFSPPPAAPPPSTVELIAYEADLRWRAEQGGTTWNGWPIHTDDRSQGKYLSELQAITLGVRVDGDPWKFADGLFRPVSNAEFPQLAIAAREHVRTVFGIEAAVLAQIEAGAVTTTAEIDAAFAAVWPSP